MEDESTLFHDHSTTEGRWSLFLHRLKWKYLIVPALFIAAIAGIGIIIAYIETDLKNNNATSSLVQLAPGISLLGAEDAALRNAKKAASWTVITQPQPGVIQAEGCENGLYAFEGFEGWEAVSSTKHLRIRYLIIDAPALTQALKEWTSLESIVIENVWVNGNFSRVYLPNLRKFIYHQYRNGHTDQYKQPETLKQILFFDKSPTGWDLHKDVLNLNMSIQVSVEGTKILRIEPDPGEVNINTHDCETYLTNYNKTKSFSLRSLSVSWCPLKNLTIEKLGKYADDLNYLFLNNAVPSSTEELGKVTSKLKNLKELHLFQRFHCDWPGFEIYLNVSDLSEELETLSITNLDLTNFGSSISVRNLSLDQYVGDNVVKNFTSFFPNLKSLALFNITESKVYSILDQILQGKTKPELLIVTNLTRLNMGSNGESGREKVEIVLTNAGIPKNATCFKLELQPNGNFVGRELTSFERNFYRFTRLAFRKIDTYGDYVTWDAAPK